MPGSCLHGYLRLWPFGTCLRDGPGKRPLLPPFLLPHSSLAGDERICGQGLVPGGAYCNQGFLDQETSISGKVPEQEKIILFDPQTSGGLLIALPASEGEKLLRKLLEKGIKEASLVGEVITREKNLITVNE